MANRLRFLTSLLIAAGSLGLISCAGAPTRGPASGEAAGDCARLFSAQATPIIESLLADSGFRAKVAAAAQTGEVAPAELLARFAYATKNMDPVIVEGLVLRIRDRWDTKTAASALYGALNRREWDVGAQDRLIESQRKLDDVEANRSLVDLAEKPLEDERMKAKLLEAVSDYQGKDPQEIVDRFVKALRLSGDQVLAGRFYARIRDEWSRAQSAAFIYRLVNIREWEDNLDRTKVETYLRGRVNVTAELFDLVEAIKVPDLSRSERRNPADDLRFGVEYWRKFFKRDTEILPHLKSLPDQEKAAYVEERAAAQAQYAREEHVKEDPILGPSNDPENVKKMLTLLGLKEQIVRVRKSSGVRRGESADPFIKEYEDYQEQAARLFAYSSLSGEVGEGIDEALREIASTYDSRTDGHGAFVRALAELALLRRGAQGVGFSSTLRFLEIASDRRRFLGVSSELVMGMLLGNKNLGSKGFEKVLGFLRTNLGDEGSAFHKMLVQRNWYSYTFYRSTLDFIEFVRIVSPTGNRYLHDFLSDYTNEERFEIPALNFGDEIKQELQPRIDEVIGAVWPR